VLINAVDPQVDIKTRTVQCYSTLQCRLINTKLFSNFLHPCDFHLVSSTEASLFFITTAVTGIFNFHFLFSSRSLLGNGKTINLINNSSGATGAANVGVGINYWSFISRLYKLALLTSNRTKPVLSKLNL